MKKLIWIEMQTKKDACILQHTLRNSDTMTNDKKMTMNTLWLNLPMSFCSTSVVICETVFHLQNSNCPIKLISTQTLFEMSVALSMNFANYSFYVTCAFSTKNIFDFNFLFIKNYNFKLITELKLTVYFFTVMIALLAYKV